jgi:hypothetical protein
MAFINAYIVNFTLIRTLASFKNNFVEQSKYVHLFTKKIKIDMYKYRLYASLFIIYYGQ